MPRPYEAVILGGTDLLRLGIPGAVSSISGLTGWWGSPAKRGEDTAKTGSDGDYPSVRSYGPRMVTVKGDVSCETRDTLFEVHDLLTGILWEGAGELRVQGHGQTQHAQVEQVGELQFAEKSPWAATWQVDLKAPDPRKYGDLRVFGPEQARTSVQVFHAGNYPAHPVIEVLTGSFMPEGFTAWGTGEDSFRVLEGVNSNETLSADFATGLVRKNGVVVYGKAGYTELARVLPKRSRAANVTPATAEGNGTYRVLVRDTWI